MPYWIQSTLLPTSALIGLFFGLGLPWSLVILPRRDWHDRVLIACLTLAIGPALLTAWMFILGSIQGDGLLRQLPILFGMGALALVGWGLVWLKRSRGISLDKKSTLPLRTDEKLLILLIIIALVIRWIGTAYWPSTAYDAQWVYAYEGKLYTLLGLIPQKIAYYPQFLPLLHTYLQVMVGGVNDHAARAILPFLHLGSILAAYVLGNRLFNRRVGIFAMAIWALYPHVGEWSRYGDLEMPLTFLFTMAAAFFVMAWTTEDETQPRIYRQYALIAGIFLGIGMWTKPTMGGFIWGVALVFIIAAAKVWWEQRNTPKGISTFLRQIRPQIEIAAITGLASIPLGAVWYLRNIALGYNPIDLPTSYWPTQAARSGVELGWPLLAILLLVAFVIAHRSYPVGTQYIVSPLRIRNLAIGLVLILIGVLPSIYNSGRVGVSEDRMGIFEWLAVAAGALILYITLMRWMRDRWTDETRTIVTNIGWLLLLALPYFVTWFYSYSYHYRLSFAIVPLMIIPSAVILAYWTQNRLVLRPTNDDSKNTYICRGASVHSLPMGRSALSPMLWQTGWLIAVICLAIPGIIAPLYDPNAGWDWLWTDKLPDDHARYVSGNKSLMSVVDGLQIYIDQHPDAPMHVIAPGIKRLPFFFPLEDIRLDTLPARLSELDGVTYFIYGRPESGADFNTFIPGKNQVLSALSLATTDVNDTGAIMRRAWGDDDGIFKYTVYELHVNNRFKEPYVNVPPQAGDVVFGNFVRFMGHDFGGDTFWPGRKLILHLYWQVLAPPPNDYMVYIHLQAPDGTVWSTWDGPVTRTNDGNYYSTLSWEPGEFITDERKLAFDNPDAPLLTKDYRLVIGLYDLATNERVPVTINGTPSGESYTLSEKISIVAEAPK